MTWLTMLKAILWRAAAAMTRVRPARPGRFGDPRPTQDQSGRPRSALPNYKQSRLDGARASSAPRRFIWARSVPCYAVGPDPLDGRSLNA